jgi:endonuclease III related protein
VTQGRARRLPEAAAGSVLASLYDVLFREYGPQGWWPVPGRAGHHGFDRGGYHPGDRRPPSRPSERFQIALGSVLTQNTAWTNAEQALTRLLQEGAASPQGILSARPGELARWIRSSGYYNQKARKLKSLAAVFRRRGALSGSPPTREELLGVWGIGEETADSILLYAYGKPVFVVDAYTRRLLARLCLTQPDEGYGALQELFQASLPRDAGLYSEYHALIVAHGKSRCRARPLCGGCPVRVCPSNPNAADRP